MTDKQYILMFITNNRQNYIAMSTGFGKMLFPGNDFWSNLHWQKGFK